MKNERIILHSDLNNFYASVECALNSSLANAPLAVCGNPELRHGIVLAKNQAAKKFGIKTGDVVWEAKQKCPALVCVPPHFDLYEEYSKKVFDLYSEFTDLVEPFGSDECWLDVTESRNLLGDGKKIADKIRAEITSRFKLTASVGVSFNKVFAKLGSDMKKPDATTVISKENFRATVWPLPAGELLYVGRATVKKLEKLNIRTVGDLAAADDRVLSAHFGVNGAKIKRYAEGLDTEPVRPYYTGRTVESVGHGMTTIKDVTSYEDAQSVLFYLSDLVAVRLRKYGFKGSGVQIACRTDSLSTFSRQKKLNASTFSAREICAHALALLKENWQLSPPLRTLTVSVFDLERTEGTPKQLSLFDTGREKTDRLEQGIDKIREKYGKKSIYTAVMMGKDFLYDKTDSEDFLPFKR